jgi:uncharacterized FAD-dependent dehydrogenase
LELIISNLRIPVEKDGIDEYVKAASQKLEFGAETIKFSRMLSKSLDMSDKDQFFYDVSVVVTVPDNFDNRQDFPAYNACNCKTQETVATSPGRLWSRHMRVNTTLHNAGTDKSGGRGLSEPQLSIHPLEKTEKPANIKERPIIVGFGPAGMFAALELLNYGIRPIIFERGKKIEERDIDVQKFVRERELDPESNIQFGEGGAGSYSDGKLFSRIRNNSGYVNRVLDTLIKFGAPEEIGYISKPHLGTDVLCRIVRNIRNHVLERGGEIHYNSKLTDIISSDGKIRGVVVNGEKEYLSSTVYLAVGHSARDTFEILHGKGVAIEQKPISVGVRVEHPAEIINLIRYGYKYKDFRGIGAATYSFNHTDRKTGRGAYTFCMCPGGEVVNASSEKGMLVLNGMSYSRRASPFSNSAIAVTCRTDDYKTASPLAGIEFQKDMERRAFNATGGTWRAPAQNLMDFLNRKNSLELNENSYKMGVASVNMNEILPGFVCESLATAFNKWKEDYPLFVSEHAILLGVETRTSSPVKIMRNEKYESVNMGNLYPIGEGSGYTGGITSSAADAIKAVELSALSHLQ